VHISSQLIAAALAPLGLLVLDAVLGVLLAVKQGGMSALSLHKLAGVAENAVVPLIVGLGGSVVEAASQSILSGNLQTPTTAVVLSLLAALAARTLVDVKDKAAALLSVAPPPASGSAAG
jgi:hypothetical protein